MKRLPAVCIAALLALLLLCAASAQATIVTVGTPLTVPFPSAPYGGALTVTNSMLPESGANVTSPITGVIIRWRVTGASGGPFRLRVLTLLAGGSYTGAGTSAPQTLSSTATQAFTTNLPINAGQTIGLDNNDAGDRIGEAGVPGAAYSYWNSPLADGQTLPPSGMAPGVELGFNADVATVPSNAYSFGKLKRNTNKGTASLAVVVPGPGTLSLTGKGVKAQRPGRAAVASKAVTAAGKVKLAIKPKGKVKKKLNKTGKAKVKVIVTYTPTGDAPGVPNTKTKRVKLVKG